MADKTRRELCERRLAGMKAQRAPYEQDWDEIQRLMLPARSEVIGNRAYGFSGDSASSSRKRRANTSMYSSKGRRAARILTAGMTSGLSSPSRPWFKLQTRDRDMMEYQPVKEWLSTVERLIYDFLGSTNFYNAAKIGYSELGCFGTEAAVMLEHPRYGAVTHVLTAGEYWIANDDGNVADTLYRSVPMTVGQMVQAFPWDRISQTVRTAFDNSRYEELINVWHAIEPNDTRDASKVDNRNKPWRSIWWEEGQKDKAVLLREGGFDDKPFWAPRWVEVGGSAVYGDGPGYDALPDLRELQLAAKRLGRAVDLLNRPPILAPVSATQSFLNLDPGAINFVANQDAAMVRPIMDPNYQNLQAIRETMQHFEGGVMECMYADLFMAISDMEGVQPRNEQELSLRNDEKLTQLGPVVERVNVEKLEVVIDRVFSILEKTQQLPPPPDELQGEPLKVDFVSILAQAQRSAGIRGIQTVAQFVGYLAGVFPGAADKFDADQAIDEFATGSGTPPKVVRSDEVVAEIRKQAAAEKNAAQAAAMAQPMQQGAAAAELLSRTNVGDQSLLETMVGA